MGVWVNPSTSVFFAIVLDKKTISVRGVFREGSHFRSLCQRPEFRPNRKSARRRILVSLHGKRTETRLEVRSRKILFGWKARRVSRLYSHCHGARQEDNLEYTKANSEG